MNRTVKTVMCSLLMAFTAWSTAADGSSLSKPAEIKAALSAHQRAIHVKDGWIRDPYVIQGLDGWFYLTGTTLLSTVKETPELKYGQGPPGYEARVWKTKDFVGWTGLGAPYSLKDGIWYTAKPERFQQVAEATADKVTGPYGARKFVGRFLGHGTPFQDDAGQWWCTAFFNANVPPLAKDGIRSRDLSQDAQTINEQGLTLVPLEVAREANDVVIRALDPDYRNPGPDELQKF